MPYNIPEHKDKTQLCIFHNDHDHTLASCKNLYNLIKSMIKKGELLKYLKKKILLRSRREMCNSDRLTVKVGTRETSKEGEAGGSGQNLWVVSYVHKEIKEK